jgi:hypothetical protein
MMRSTGAWLLTLLCLTNAAAAQATQPITAVHFSIDAARDVHPISRFIYGINRLCQGQYQHLTLTRLGGNRWTCYNWTNNASNAGNDYHYQNDGFLGGGNRPGGAVAAALDQNVAVILTVPINGYVSADKRADGDVRLSGTDYLAARFRPEQPAKGAAFTVTPDPNSPVVYQDEFVNWVKTEYPAGFSDPGRPIFFMLDNEPAIWSQTHAEAHPAKLTYEELADKSIAYAAAVKSVAPSTLIFGPAEYGWSGFMTLQNAPDSKEHGDFLTYYLARMADAEAVHGHRLLDVLDVHWYPEARAGTVRITARDASAPVAAVRMQAPRSLWDKTYTESSWIARAHGPIALLPQLQSRLNAYPGTRLSISEYNYGGWADISGAIAEADVLGIFGRANLFAACEWPLSRQEPFTAAAFAMYRDIDGNGSALGDTSVFAANDDAADTSIYASLDSHDPKRMVLVAINKTDGPIDATMNITGAPAWASADVYQLTSAAPQPKSAGIIHPADPAVLRYTLPPLSVSTLVLR